MERRKVFDAQGGDPLGVIVDILYACIASSWNNYG